MKKLILEELIILSTHEKRAKKVKFNSKATIIEGGNNTGKSSLIKSIYKTFGADAFKVNPTWKSLSPYTLVKFKIDENAYAILQFNNNYAIFDSNGKAIGTFNNVTKGLTPFLAELLDFKIKIRTHQSGMITPPSQYMFLPFYIDQDGSWNKTWSSFSGLTQLPKWRPDLISYFAGVRPNEYYEIKGKINDVENKLRELTAEERMLTFTIDKIGEDVSSVNFDVDIDNFKKEVEDLLNKSHELQSIEVNLKHKLIDLYNIKNSLLDQINIAENALSEINSNYVFATEKVPGDTVDCPTCGAVYDNSFSEIFDIAKDEDRCAELILTLKADLQEVEQKIAKTKLEFDSNKEDSLKIVEILNAKNDVLKLNDLLKIEGKKEIKLKVESELNQIFADQGTNNQTLEKLKTDIKEYEDKKRSSMIEATYIKQIEIYLNSLNVNLNPNVYKRLNSEINTTGSELPRALLAYYFSFFKVMKEYSSSFFCPIVIDSPNQQAQDAINIKAMLEFIRDNQPEDTQMILGLEDSFGVEFTGNKITLDKPRQLLNEAEYEEANKVISGFMKTIV